MGMCTLRMFAGEGDDTSVLLTLFCTPAIDVRRCLCGEVHPVLGIQGHHVPPADSFGHDCVT